MSELLLPPAVLAASATARLPQNYIEARRALAECERIDVCKDWSDKAAALASYARRINNDELLQRAVRIQAIAVRRAGELLAEIEPSKGGDASLFDARDGTVPSVTRTAAADAAGLSERQRKTALRVAAIDDDEFDELIAAVTVPTVTALARKGLALARKQTNADIMAVRRAMREAYDEECAHPTKDPEPAAGAPNVYDYCLTDKPDVWRILICPGDGLDEATRIVEDQFGAERVLAVRAHLPAAGLPTACQPGRLAEQAGG